MATSKRLGELNGKYALLFKINMALIPIIFMALLTWGIWVTANIYDFRGFMDYGDRYSMEDAHVEHNEILSYVEGHYVRKPE